MKSKNIDDQNDEISAQVDIEIPNPIGGFESEDLADAHRAMRDARFIELCNNYHILAE